ncbi:MAG TPA: hypothetical protein VNO70_04985 [Blastocatellia bacterium]|nr:hypothetical protein [Blastocatellia bacterium]
MAQVQGRCPWLPYLAPLGLIDARRAGYNISHSVFYFAPLGLIACAAFTPRIWTTGVVAVAPEPIYGFYSAHPGNS